MTRRQCLDAGLALVLVCLLAAWLGERAWAVPLAAGLVLLLMVRPGALGPFARLWFGLSHVLGAVMSRVILTLVFFLVVTPVGLARRAMGRDALRLRAFRQGQGSVFRVRDKTLGPGDLEELF